MGIIIIFDGHSSLCLQHKSESNQFPVGKSIPCQLSSGLVFKSQKRAN